MTKNSFMLGGIIAAIFLFSTAGIPQGTWISSSSVNAQSDSSNQTAVIDQLVSNLSEQRPLEVVILLQ